MVYFLLFQNYRIPNELSSLYTSGGYIFCLCNKVSFTVLYIVFQMETLFNVTFLDGDVPRCPFYGIYISQLIRFARVCSNVDDFNNRNLLLTAKLLTQGYRYHKIRTAFSKFYHRHSELIVKYNIGLKTLLQQGISEPIFYGNLVYKFKRLVETLF